MAGGVDPPVLTGKIINCTDFPARQVELPKGIPYGNESHSWYPVVNPKVFGCESLTPVNYFWVITTVIYSYFCDLQFWWTSFCQFFGSQDTGAMVFSIKLFSGYWSFGPIPVGWWDGGHGGHGGHGPWGDPQPWLVYGKSQQKPWMMTGGTLHEHGNPLNRPKSVSISH